MIHTGLVICLAASVSAIVGRLTDDGGRPLLAGPDSAQRINDLLHERAAAYAEMPYRIDTTGRSVADVADEVIALAGRGLGGVLRLPVTTPDGGAGYDIWVGSGLLGELPGLLAERRLNGRVALVTDEHVAVHWAEPAQKAFERAGRAAALIVLPAGEEHKTLATMAAIYDGLISAGLDRQGVVVALGGGVIGDMAGFAAASFLRGVHFVQAPTTLLAMVDASVGGKTGVDLPQGKNLVGAFKQPDLVVADTATLATLPAREFRCGLAEVVKHGVIADPDLFARLEGDGPDSLESLVAQAVRVKIAVVQRDPFERGERAHLNLGHTFGHAIEQVSGYTVPHGEGVALGMVAAAHLAENRRLCSPDLTARLEALLVHLGLPIRWGPFNPDAVLAAMSTDKKRQSGRLRFVLPRALGDVAVYDDVTPAEVLTALSVMMSDNVVK